MTETDPIIREMWREAILDAKEQDEDGMPGPCPITCFLTEDGTMSDNPLDPEVAAVCVLVAVPRGKASELAARVSASLGHPVPTERYLIHRGTAKQIGICFRGECGHR